MAKRLSVVAKDTAPLAGRPWTRHYDVGVPATLTYPDATMHAFLQDAADSFPDATATIFFNKKRTYKSISDDAWRFANGLRKLGVKKGDRVAVMLPNTPQFIVAFYGALRAGATVVPCNPLYTAPELRHQLADSGAQTLVVLSRLYPVAKAGREGTNVKNVIVTNIKEEMPLVLRTLFTLAKEKKDGHRQPFKGDPGALAFRDVLDASAEPFDAGVKKDDIALLQYTGGTTGVSKGAMLSHRALVANTLQCRAWFVGTKDTEGRTMAVMPFFHVYGLTVVMSLAIQAAGAMVLEPQFELKRVLEDVAKHKPSTFSGAPRIYNAIINSPLATEYDLRSIDACISGSAPLMVETHRKFVELTGANLVEGYGLTEAAPVTHCNPLYGKGKQKIGRPQEGDDHRLRVQRVPARGRGGACVASRGDGQRRDRQAASDQGRRGQGLRGAEARPDRDAGGAHRAHALAAGAVQGAARDRIQGIAAKDAHREDPAPAARGRGPEEARKGGDPGVARAAASGRPG